MPSSTGGMRRCGRSIGGWLSLCGISLLWVSPPPWECVEPKIGRNRCGKTHFDILRGVLPKKKISYHEINAVAGSCSALNRMLLVLESRLDCVCLT